MLLFVAIMDKAVPSFYLYVELLITVSAVQGAAARSRPARAPPSHTNRETRDAMC